MTAEEIYEEYVCSKKTDIIEAMKLYAQQVAEQTLRDAADSVEWTDCQKESILETQIILP